MTNIKPLRLLTGMSITEAAAAAGISKSYWGAVERGALMASGPILKSMANVLGVSIHSLGIRFDGATINVPSTPVVEAVLKANESPMQNTNERRAIKAALLSNLTLIEDDFDLLAEINSACFYRMRQHPRFKEWSAKKPVYSNPKPEWR